MKDKFIEVNGSPTHYKVAGSGQPIIILHGWLSSGEVWQTIQEKLSLQNFKVIVPDLPGFGKTPLPDSGGWSLDNYVRWLEYFTKKLVATNKLETPFVLAGHSFGGRVAIKVAAKKSLPLSSLILIDAAGILQAPSLEKKIIANFSKTLQKCLDVMNISPKFREKLKILGYQLIRQKDYLKASQEIRKTFQKIIGEDLLPILHKIEAHTLIVWGEQDELLPVEHAYIFHKNIPHSTLKIIAEARHSPEIQTPDKLLKILVNFLKKND